MKTSGKVISAIFVVASLCLTNSADILATSTTTSEETSNESVTYEGRVQEVDELIANIGNVTLDSKDVIEQARAAYNALSIEERALSLNGYLLFEAERIYDLLIHTPTKDMDELEQLDYRMGQLQDFTIANWQEINTINNMYQMLSEQEKAQLDNGQSFFLKYQTYLLENTGAQDLQEANVDATIVDEFINMIATAEEKEIYITQARNAYNALTDEQKLEVQNYQVLLDAEAKQQVETKEETTIDKKLEKEDVETGSVTLLPWIFGLGVSALGIVGMKRKR